MVTTTKYTDAYNIAVQYLKVKYGIKYCGLTCAAQKRSDALMFVTKNKRKKIEASYTDNDYNTTFNEAFEYSDIEISLLLKQYYFCESVKIELKNKLEYLGLM